VSDKTARAALEKLAKWRKFFASWQLGTRAASDGEYRAVADAREMLIIMRAEVNALTELMLRKGVITEAEFQAALEREAKTLDKDYAKRFPGFSTSELGLSMKMPEAGETMRKLGFPP
jgi:hypothetical protein